MDWSSSADTLAQVRLEFPSREAAIVYAHQNGIAATVAAPQSMHSVRMDNSMFSPS
jgi:hypothetical protein